MIQALEGGLNYKKECRSIFFLALKGMRKDQCSDNKVIFHHNVLMLTLF